MAGEVTKWTLSKCAAVKGCENTPTVEAVNLPWKVELVAAGSGLEEKLVSSGKGTPGFTMSCEALHVKAVDTCTASLVQSTTNGTGGVSAAFLASEKLNCTLGGTGSGVLEGSNTIEATSGGKLSAELETPPSWRSNGAQLEKATAFKWKGAVNISATYPVDGTLELECEDTGTGSVGPVDDSEMTKWTLSGCHDIRGCEGASSIEALDLPWHSELYTVEGAIQNWTGSGTGGKPGFKFSCTALGEKFTAECNWVPVSTLTNTLAGVTSAFDREGKSCGAVAKNGGSVILGSQAMELLTGKLSAS